MKAKNKIYVSSQAELQAVLDDRKSRSGEIDKKVDQWIFSEYGIPSFTHTVRSYFSLKDESETLGILCRQIGSMSTEDVAIYFLAQELGLVPFLGTFYQDSFTSVNHDKKARVKIPWNSWSKKGNLVVKHEQVVPQELGLLEGMVLNRIMTSENQSLPKFHEAMRARLFEGCRYPMIDFSELDISLYRASSKNRPAYILLEGEQGRTKRAHDFDPGNETRFRLPADWYYVLYLSFFLNGSMVLMETYENPEGGVPEAKVLFEKSMETICEHIGEYPIVVEIPPLTKEMLYCNQALLEKGALQKLTVAVADTQQDSMGSTVDRAHVIAKTIIGFH